MELTPVDVRDASGIEHSIAGLTCGSNSGLIVTISPLAFLRRELIIALAARHRLPAVYAIRVFVADGGLMSYGPDEIEQHRRRLRRPHPQGREAGRPTGAGADQI